MRSPPPLSIHRDRTVSLEMRSKKKKKTVHTRIAHIAPTYNTMPITSRIKLLLHIHSRICMYIYIYYNIFHSTVVRICHDRLTAWKNYQH